MSEPKVVLRARPLVIGRIKSCGGIHWTGAMHLVHADSHEEAWRYETSFPLNLMTGGETWDAAAEAARMVLSSGLDVVRRQLANRPDVEIVEALREVS